MTVEQKFSRLLSTEREHATSECCLLCFTWVCKRSFADLDIQFLQRPHFACAAGLGPGPGTSPVLLHYALAW